MDKKNQAKGLFVQLLEMSQVSVAGLGLLLALLVVGTGVGTVQPLFMGRVFDSLSVPNAESLIPIVVEMGLIFLLSLVLSLAKDRVAATLAVQSENSIREKVISSLLNDEKEMDAGNLPVFLEEDSKLLSTIIFQHSELVSDILSLLMAILFMLWLNVKLTLAFFLLLPIQVLVLLIFGKLLAQKEEEIKENKENYLKHAMESIAGRKNIVVFGKKAERLKEFSGHSKTFSLSKFQYFWRQSIQGSLLQCVFFSYNILMILGGMFLIQGGEMTLGAFISYITYSNSMLAAGFSLAEFNSAYQTMRISLSRLQSCIRDEGRIEQTEEGLEPVEEFTVRGLDYSISNHQLFKGLNIHFKAGELYLVQSPSGRGKATLFNLFSGLVQPDKGIFLINHQQVASIPQDRISYMLQESYLFSMSILENIRFYNPAVSRTDIREICYLLGLEEFIDSLKNGYDTVVSAENIRLSGGQIRRLCLARTLLRPADIYLLDEPLANLDKDRRVAIVSYLRDLSRRAIVIMNSHDDLVDRDGIKLVEIGG